MYYQNVSSDGPAAGAGVDSVSRTEHGKPTSDAGLFSWIFINS